jgi:hypothetical protein
MAVTYAAGLKTSRMQEVVDAIGASGKLEIGTAGMAAVLATIALANPAGSVSGAVLTLDLPASDTSADGTGTAAAARIRTGADADVVTGLTVGLAAADIILDSLNVTAGQTLTVSSGTLTHG